MGPIHVRSIRAPVFDQKVSSNDWRTQRALAKAMDLAQVKEALAKLPALFEEVVNSCSEADLREETEMFGGQASRGSRFVSLVLSHYAAYRMQMFLYLKASGHHEPGTLNLWAGMDAQSAPGPQCCGRSAIK